jgi:hypothetical protein
VTIASCYLSPEGVVLGADSTSTYATPSGNHYFTTVRKSSRLAKVRRWELLRGDLVELRSVATARWSHCWRVI